MSALSCLDILNGKAIVDAPVTIKGWVKTRRDSKAGISFVNVSDGSCFHPVQVVAPNTLANYVDEVQKLTAGCAVEATGLIVASPAKGQPFEMQAISIIVFVASRKVVRKCGLMPSTRASSARLSGVA